MTFSTSVVKDRTQLNKPKFIKSICFYDLLLLLYPFSSGYTLRRYFFQISCVATFYRWRCNSSNIRGEKIWLPVPDSAQRQKPAPDGKTKAHYFSFARRFSLVQTMWATGADNFCGRLYARCEQEWLHVQFSKGSGKVTFPKYQVVRKSQKNAFVSASYVKLKDGHVFSSVCLSSQF